VVEIVAGQVYTVQEVAEYLRCSPRQVFRFIKDGRLAGFKVGRLRRFKGQEVLSLIERGVSLATRPPPTAASAAATPPAPKSRVVEANQLYTLPEVADLLQLPANDVLHLARQGQLPGFRVGMEWRFWGRDLLKLQGTTGGAAAVVKPSQEQGAAEPG